MPAPVSRFVNLRKSETDRQQLVLLAYRPGAREIKALAQPQHGFEPPDRASCRAEGLKAADPRHVLLDPEMVALDPLLQVLGDIVDRILREEPVFPGGRDGRRVGAGAIVPIRSGASKGWFCSIFRKKRLAASRSRFAVRRKSTGVPCLSMARYR
jgi:hypothetical protein